MKTTIITMLVSLGRSTLSSIWAWLSGMYQAAKAGFHTARDQFRDGKVAESIEAEQAISDAGDAAVQTPVSVDDIGAYDYGDEDDA